MKNKIFALVLSMLIAMPCFLHAEEVEIQLFEVVGMGMIPGDDPLDNPDKEGSTPTRPTNFHATINGNILSISIEEPAITSAQAVVTNNAGGTVVNQSFSTVLVEPIANSGAYVLEIQTDGGSLMGFFNVQ